LFLERFGNIHTVINLYNKKWNDLIVCELLEMMI